MTRLDPVRLLAVARKEARQLRRDRRSLGLAFLLPLLLLVFFGYAISWDVRDIALAVVDQDGSAIQDRSGNDHLGIFDSFVFDEDQGR